MSVMEKVGSWAFIIGVVIAVVAGFRPASHVLTSTLIALGLIVGFVNITSHETEKYLLAAVSLVVVTKFGGDYVGEIQVVGTVLKNVLGAIQTFVTPATIIVALKAIYSLAQEK